MASNLFRLFREQEARALTSEEIERAVDAVNANIEKIQVFKRMYLEYGDARRFEEADEEERMLRRLLAEYKMLSGR